MSIINATPLLAAAGGDYQISRSVRLRSSASAYFNRTPASAGNRQIMTFSWWMKLGNTAGAIFGAPSTTNPRMQVYYNGPSDGRFELYQSDGGGSQVCYTLTSARYRDPSAWYHFVIAIDTTQATAANRIKWYVNGAQLTAFDTAAYPAQNTNMEWNAAVVHNIGRQPNGGSYFDGYLTEVNFIDGQALTPSSFGETDSITGVWKPKKYAGTYGTNGFYLNFSDNSAATAAAIGKDNSGNGNNWTPNNISVTAGATYDSMLDVPTLYADGGNGRGNYCTLNSVDTALFGGGSISEANLAFTSQNAGGNGGALGTIATTTGKYYFEFESVSNGGFGQPYGGIRDITAASGYLLGTGNGNPNSAYGTYAVAVDIDAGKVWFRNTSGAWISGDPVAGTSPSNTFTANNLITPYAYGSRTSGSNNSAIVKLNFGQRPFAYTPPTGFKALNTQNLPEPTIKKGNQYFDATTYTGTGASRSVTNAGAFQPDLVWLKLRSGADSHGLFDSVRGAGLRLQSNDAGAEASRSDVLTSFSSNGFTISGSDSQSNANGSSYVGWQWKESPSAGFDIVTYTGDGAAGRTVAHSLGASPAMIIVKRRDTSSDWAVWHKSLTQTSGTLWLNLTVAQATYPNRFDSSGFTSSVFKFGSTVGEVNANGGTYVAYLFAEVAGFSKFGSYTGNGSSTDGPFVYLGFRPKFVMVKRTDAVSSWNMFDSGRSINNVTGNLLNANLSDVEYTQPPYMDFLSNGFKVRTNDAGQTTGNENQNGATYIYAAFAENPFKNSLAR